jgi:hypothetical protein
VAILDEIRRIAEVEFASIVTDVAVMGVKLRIILTDTSYVDVWVSKKLESRFGFHWERGHLAGTIYRYDNFPDTDWKHIPTYPFHFHNGSQDAVEAPSFSQDVIQGFRDFMGFVEAEMVGGG